ncbi:MAG: OB-fold nucleic acid binding domain-containing protein [Armatimonadota bacterium]
MSRLIPMTIAMTVGLAGSAAAGTQNVQKMTEGTPVRLVGVISSQPRDIGVTHEEKMQVAIGPNKTDYTLHFDEAELIGFHGDKISGDDFRDKMWVYAEGTVMDDARRIKVKRLQVVGGDEAGYRNSRFFRSGFNQGYVVSTGSSPVKAFAENTPVTVVGRISSPPKGELNEQKMQVAVGPQDTDYTLHFSDATILGMNGQTLDEDGLDDGMWVRAEGRVMDDARRIKVTRVQVIAPDEQSFRRTAFYRPGLSRGYVSAVAGARETYPSTTDTRFQPGQITLVGKVSDDTGTFETTRKIQVMTAGNEWTLSVPENAMVVDDKGEKISVHEIDDGQWVRVTGRQTDDLRLEVNRIENIGRDEAFRTSRFFRTGEPMGYVERVAGERREGRRVNLRGTVHEVHPDRGYFILRDNSGRMHRVYMDNVNVMRDGRSMGFDMLREGDRVAVSGTSR